MASVVISPLVLALTFVCLMLGPLCPYITTNLTFVRSPWKFPVLHCLWVNHYIEQWTLFFLVNCSPIMHNGNMLINSNPWTSVFYILLTDSLFPQLYWSPIRYNANMLVNSNSPTPHITPPKIFAKIVLGLVKMGATKYLQNMGTDYIVKPRPSTYTRRKMPHFSKKHPLSFSY